MIRPGIRRAFHLGLWRRDRHDRDVDDEIALHVALRTEELIRAGLSPEVAHAEAVRRFGGRSLADAQRSVRGPARRRAQRMRFSDWIAAAADDLRYGVRGLRREPTFALAMILTLALGIGANVTMFSVVDQLLFRAPAHVREPERLMHVGLVRVARGTESVQRVLSYAIYRDLRELSAFEQVAVSQSTSLPVGRGAEARQLEGMVVSASYFPALGVQAALGRFFLPDEDREPAGLPVAVVGYEYWQRELAADRAVLGRSLTIAGRAYAIVGVAPAGLSGADRGGRPDVWLPITAVRSGGPADSSWMAGRQSYWLSVVARLRPGVSPERAAAEATSAIRAAEEREWGKPRTPAVRLVSVLPRDALADRPEAKTARLLLGVSVLVLLIACANTANLQLARTLRRRREVAVRLALGMGRGRLVAQLMLESVLLAVIGAGRPWSWLVGGGSLLRALLAGALPPGESPIDLRIVGFAVGVAFLAGALSALAPAVWAGRTDLPEALKQGTRSVGGRRSRLRTGLILTQAAFSALLLAGAGLFVRSLLRANALPLGIETDRVLIAMPNTDGGALTRQQLESLFRRIADAARAMPDVQGVAASVSLPFSSSYAADVRVAGRDSLPMTAAGGPYINGVSPGFFETLGTRVLRGRAFTDADLAGAPRVAVVNQTLARLWWPGTEALGQCLFIGDAGAPCTTVIGVAENARRQSLLEEESVQFYVPLEQMPDFLFTNVLFIRPSGDPARVAESIRRRLQVAVADAPYISMIPMATRVDANKRSWRLGSTVFGAFGALAIVLAAVGLYGLLAYEVTQRTRELGVRMALGAQRSDIAVSVLRTGVSTIAIGAVIGLLGTLVAAPFVQPLLLQTLPRDPLVLSIVAVVLMIVAMAASLIPAGRATRVDPATAIRAD